MGSRVLGRPTFLLSAAWWLLGVGALRGRADSGLLMAWLLLLATSIPLEVWASWTRDGCFRVGSAGGGDRLRRLGLCAAVRSRRNRHPRLVASGEMKWEKSGVEEYGGPRWSVAVAQRACGGPAAGGGLGLEPGERRLRGEDRGASAAWRHRGENPGTPRRGPARGACGAKCGAQSRGTAESG